MRGARTYALLQVSQATYAEIRDKLKATEYDHAFHSDDGREVIDMDGLALLGPDSAPAPAAPADRTP